MRVAAAFAGPLWCWSAAAQPALSKEWPAPKYAFEGNPVTPAGFALGRELFYDPVLSRDGTVSCGSCHQQFAAFANLDHRVSHGVAGALGKRNAPGLFNLAWAPQFMWDGAATHLETQPILPIGNPLEMGETLASAIEKLKAGSKYPALFAQAFGTPNIDSQRTLRALAQFTGSMVSDQSPYDDYMRGRGGLSKDQLAGLAVFRDKCSGCHQEPLFTDFSYRSNGLDAAVTDIGRAGVTASPEDRGRFRVPSLRNVALTAPYMHDGRYSTLDQVLDHYDHGIQNSAVLDPSLAQGIALDASQRQALLSFLGALTDSRFIHDPRFSPVPAQAPHQSAWAALLQWLGARAGSSTPSTPLVSTSAHLLAQSDRSELIALLQSGELTIYLDDPATNAPIVGASLDVRSGRSLLHATEQSPGVYSVPAESIVVVDAPDISFTVHQPAGDERLQAHWQPQTGIAPLIERSGSFTGAMLAVLSALATVLLFLWAGRIQLRARRLTA